jgi:hypothetical protein
MRPRWNSTAMIGGRGPVPPVRYAGPGRERRIRAELLVWWSSLPRRSGSPARLAILYTRSTGKLQQDTLGFRMLPARQRREQRHKQCTSGPNPPTTALSPPEIRPSASVAPSLNANVRDQGRCASTSTATPIATPPAAPSARMSSRRRPEPPGSMGYASPNMSAPGRATSCVRSAGATVWSCSAALRSRPRSGMCSSLASTSCRRPRLSPRAWWRPCGRSAHWPCSRIPPAPASRPSRRRCAAVETHNGSDSHEQTTAAGGLVDGMALPGIGGSDCHAAHEVGRAWTVLPHPVRDERGLVAALRLGRHRAERATHG